jgi:hypothetical protein
MDPGDGEVHLKAIQECDAGRATTDAKDIQSDIAHYECLTGFDDLATGKIDALLTAAQLPANSSNTFLLYRDAMGVLDSDGRVELNALNMMPSICMLVSGADTIGAGMCAVASEDNLAGFIDRYVNFDMNLNGAPKNPLSDAPFRMRHSACYTTFDAANSAATTPLQIVNANKALSDCIKTDTLARRVPPEVDASLVPAAVSAATDATKALCQVVVGAGPSQLSTVGHDIFVAKCLVEGANLIDALFN